MANENRLIDANALCEFFQERYLYLRNASETQLPNGRVEIDLDIQVGAIIAKEFLDKAKQAPTVDAVEVVHGWWMPQYDRCWIDGQRWKTGYHCSSCMGFNKVESHYCPNCGAKMDGGNDDA